MPSSFTENYSLNQWSRDDRVLMEDFNADNAKIDGAIKAEADARTAADNALSAALAAEKTARQAELAALAQSRNCQIYCTTYAGTGTFGGSAPNQLTFSHKPVFVHVAGDRLQNFSAVRDNPYAVELDAAGSPGVLELSWGQNTLSWYSPAGAGRQLNDEGKTYYVFAVLELNS